MPREIQELYDYDRWASRRILAACAGLSAEQLGRNLGSSFPSVLATLEHMLSANWIWLERWQGRSPGNVPASWNISGWDALEHEWADVERRQGTFIAGLREDDLRRVLDYRNTAGTPFAAPLWQLLRHVVNHATYHRGQVVTMLRQLGSPAPSTDLVLYHREQCG